MPSRKKIESLRPKFIDDFLLSHREFSFLHVGNLSIKKCLYISIVLVPSYFYRLDFYSRPLFSPLPFRALFRDLVIYGVFRKGDAVLAQNKKRKKVECLILVCKHIVMSIRSSLNVPSVLVLARFYDHVALYGVSVKDTWFRHRKRESYKKKQKKRVQRFVSIASIYRLPIHGSSSVSSAWK